MRSSIKKKLVKKQIIKAVPVLLILFGFAFVILFSTSNLIKKSDISLAPPTDIEYYGFTKGFKPVVAVEFPDNYIGLWDANGQYYILNSTSGNKVTWKNFTAEISQSPYNIPSNFKPITGYYVPLPGPNQNGRIDLWNSNGEVRSFRPATNLNQGQSFGNVRPYYTSQGVPPNFNPVSGTFAGIFGGFIMLVNTSNGASSDRSIFFLNMSEKFIGNASGLYNASTSDGNFPLVVPDLEYYGYNDYCFQFKIIGDTNNDSKITDNDFDMLIDAPNHAYNPCFDLNNDGINNGLDVANAHLKSNHWPNLPAPSYWPFPEAWNGSVAELNSSQLDYLIDVEGQSEVVFALFGYDPLTQENVILSGEETIEFNSPSDVPDQIPSIMYKHRNQEKNLITWFGEKAYIVDIFDDSEFAEIKIFYSCNTAENVSSCLDSSTREYCSPEGILTEETCEYQCEAGKCIDTPFNPTSCEDTDSNEGGTGAIAFGAYINGSVTYPKNGNPVIVHDYCKDNNTLIEQICNFDFSAESAGNITYTCPQGCSEGKCSGSPTEICQDSDSGKNTTSFGTTSYVAGSNTLESYEDVCLSSSQLVEFFCLENILDFDIFSCSTSCQNGLCTLPITTQTTNQTSQNNEDDDTGISILGAIIISLIILLLIIISFLIYYLIKKNNEKQNNEEVPQIKNDSPPSPPTPKIPLKNIPPKQDQYLPVNNEEKPNFQQNTIPSNKKQIPNQRKPNYRPYNYNPTTPRPSQQRPPQRPRRPPY